MELRGPPEGDNRACHQNLLSSLGIGTKSAERPQQVGYYRAEGETWGLNLEENRESEDLKLTCLLH